MGLITNQTGVDSQGHSTVDILAKAPNVRLIALFSPEHGLRGTVEHGQTVLDAYDPKTHLPVYSLYGATQKPTLEMLNAIDVLVFDMQDVGARFYTYLTTMGLAMEAASDRGIDFIVLDRPNPLGGAVVEGPVLDLKYRHFTAYYAVPIRHGFTAGELAGWYKQTAHLKTPLKVIRMTNWKRTYLWKETGLEFIPPSPNIRNPKAAFLYAGIGMFEATNLSVGRGTPFPFETIGAPWIDGKVLAARLNDLDIPGVRFKKIVFTPTQDVHQGLLCSGVQIHLARKYAQVRSVDLFVQIACLLRELHPQAFQLRWDEIARVTGTQEFEKMYKDNRSASEILNVFHQSAEQFVKDRMKYLLY